MSSKRLARSGAQGVTKRRSVFCWLARIALAVVLGGHCLAATYYVATTGSDSNVGSQSSPWRTIQKAANTVAAGDTVIVQAGTYSENVMLTGAYGTENSRITFQAEGSVTNRSWYISKPYYSVIGFTMTGDLTSVQGIVSILISAHGTMIVSNTIAPSETSPSGLYGIWMDYNSPGVAPSNCVLSANSVLNTKNHALNINGYGNLIEGNYITGTNGWDAIRAGCVNTTFRGNIFTNWSNLSGNSNHPDIIQAFSSGGGVSTNCVFERNIIMDCQGVQIGMFEDQLQQGTIGDWTFRNNLYVRCEAAFNSYVRDMKWYNNTFVDSGINTGSPLLFKTSTDRGNSHGAQVINNIFVRCGSNGAGSFAFMTGLNGTFETNNLVQTVSGGTDVKLVNSFGSEVRDFELQPDSPALRAGYDLSQMFNEDMLGRVRSGAWDIGALAFPTSSATDRPGPPRALRIP